MAFHQPNIKAKNRPRPAKVATANFPAPTKGVDARVPLAANDLSVCNYAYNIMPVEEGMRVRSGYREWNIELESASDAGTGVSTIIPFEAFDGAANDKLFAVTNEGIWDVTTFDDGPHTRKVNFSDTGADAGYGHFINYVTAAGAQLIFYADTKNGLYTYTASTDTWAATTGITGITIADIVGIVVHKLRIWVFLVDDAAGYYLPVNAIAGAATAFDFGQKFKRGGHITGLYNWSLDGGDGVDDYLVAVSSAGDALPYRGEDPSAAATWQLKGSYFIGAMPEGYRAGLEYEGELYILSTTGMVSMREVLQGVSSAVLRPSNISYKLAKVLQSSMKTLRTSKGWAQHYIPTDGTIIIVSPVQADGTFIQYALNVTGEGWGFWRGPPILSLGVWQDKVYFGTTDDRVMVMDVDRDNQLITPPAAPLLNGSAIAYSMLTAYSDMEAPGQFKRGQFIRPYWLAKAQPTYSTKFLFDYDLAELGAVPAQAVTSTGTWDVGLWDIATWGTDTDSPYANVCGVTGMGIMCAIAIKGTAVADTLLLSIDAVWQNAGPL